MAEAPRPPHTPQDNGNRWQLALQFIGAGAAIGAWIAVIGGARMWARLDTIGVPPAQAVSTLPRELLIAEGLRTLAVPLLLGGAIAIVVYFSRRREEDLPPSPAQHESRNDLLHRLTFLSGHTCKKTLASKGEIAEP